MASKRKGKINAGLAAYMAKKKAGQLHPRKPTPPGKKKPSGKARHRPPPKPHTATVNFHSTKKTLTLF